MGPTELFLLLVGLALYGTPAFVAFGRDHHNARAILALNVLLGWTVLGWIGALVWALTATPQAITHRPE